MTAWQRAEQWWKQHNKTDFAQVVAAHLASGYVWSSPDYFMLAHDLHWDGKEARTDMEPNAWFITMATSSSGNGVRKLLNLLPRREWLAWIRNGGTKMKIYRHEAIARKAGY